MWIQAPNYHESHVNYHFPKLCNFVLTRLPDEIFYFRWWVLRPAPGKQSKWCLIDFLDLNISWGVEKTGHSYVKIFEYWAFASKSRGGKTPFFSLFFLHNISFSTLHLPSFFFLITYLAAACSFRLRDKLNTLDQIDHK